MSRIGRDTLDARLVKLVNVMHARLDGGIQA